MLGGIVPQPHQDTFPFGGQPLAEPGEKGRRDVTHGPDGGQTTPPHLVGKAQYPVGMLVL
jgi:hypothetical protein